MCNLRRASIEDAEAIARVHVASWQGAYAGVLSEDFLAGLSVDRRAEGWRRLWTQQPDLHVYVAERDGAIVGFASTGSSRDEDAGESCGELEAIYLDTTFWGTGVGARLHALVIDDLAAGGFTEATLWVLDANARARLFYERHGWRLDTLVRDDEIGGVAVREVRYRRKLAPGT